MKTDHSEQRANLSPKISVVVPVYKVERFIAECLESILAQDFEAFEVVVVDDGSPDSSGRICDEFAARDPRVRVFHQENGGVSSARKLGTERSRGEWICLVDSDDVLPPHALAPLFAATRQFPEADIVEGGSADFTEMSEIPEKLRAAAPADEARFGKPLVVSGLDYAKALAAYRRVSFEITPWRKIIRRDVLLKTDALNIPRKLRYGEDTMMDFRMATGTRFAVRISSIVYCHRNNESSITHEAGARSLPPEYTAYRWELLRGAFADQSEEWQVVWKSYIAMAFLSTVLGSSRKILEHPQIRPFIPIIASVEPADPTLLRKLLLKFILLGTRFPFSLIPERVFLLLPRLAFRLRSRVRSKS